MPRVAMKILAWSLLLSLFVTLAASKSTTYRGIRWWYLGNDMQNQQSAFRLNSINYVTSDVPTMNSMNPSLSLLTKKQRKLVARNPGSVVIISKGARMAIQECQYQFKNARWNCSTTAPNGGGFVFGSMVGIGCRETSFLYAIMSSATTHAIARACSEGKMFTCSCDHRRDETPSIGDSSDWKWGGCSDNVQFGNRFARLLADGEETERDLRAAVNRHNNEAGRTHVVDLTAQQCKCHGTSGSCTVKTCWMRLPSLRQIGNLLKEKFDGASKVYADNTGRPGSRVKRANFVPVDASHKVPSAGDLVYFENSPDFCVGSVGLDIGGTSGRECNATSADTDACELLCCGRGYRSEESVVLERCSCNFHWCCEVTCKVCEKQKFRHICY